MKQQQASRQKAPGGARAVTVGVAVVALTVAGGLFLLSGGWAAGAGGGWLKAAVRNPLFVVCGLVTGGCVVGLAVLCGALWAAGAGGRAGRDGGSVGDLPGGAAEAEAAAETAQEQETHGRDARGTHGRDAHATQRGAATLEFALVLPIALMIVLVMIQSSLVMGGNLCVNYAAFCAARTAIVTVPLQSGDEERNMVADPAASAKMRRIQMAAVWAVLPVSCAHPDGPSVNADSLADALSSVLAVVPGGVPSWVRRDLGRRLAYAQDHTTVELTPPTGQPVPGGGRIKPAPPKPGAYAAGEDLHVRVRHDFYLSVPYAAGVFSKVAGDGMRLNFGQGQFALTMRAECTLTNEGEQDYVDVETFPKDRRR